MKYKKLFLLGLSLLLTSCSLIINPSNNIDSNDISVDDSNSASNSNGDISDDTVSNDCVSSNTVVANCSTVTINQEIGQSILLSTKTFDTYLNKTGIINSFNGTSVYGGGSASIRIGTSATDGNIIINIKKAKVQAIEIEGGVWKGDSKTGTSVSLSNGESKDYQWMENTDVKHTYSFNGTSTSTSITISTKGGTKNRLVIETIRIFAEEVAEEVKDSSSVTSNNSTINNDATILSCVSKYSLTGGKIPNVKQEFDGFYRAPLSTTLTQSKYDEAIEDDHLNHMGYAKILVVPVDFTDYKASQLGDEEDTQRDIYNTFFGESSDTGWESVKTYYEKSSYGAMTLEGCVLPWYHSSYTTKTFANLKGSGEYASIYDPTWTMVDKVTEYAKSLGINLKDYDNDGDGLIDGIWMVYACKAEYLSFRDDPNSIFWAYTFANQNNYEKKSRFSPVPYSYCWGSYSFTKEGKYGKVDAHTYIHETGHLLGLEDYYDVEGKDGVCGGVDMMDNNIGDHSAYSKFLMDWTSPYVVDGTKETTTITLKPFESSGDFVLLKDESWNGSPLDEYVLIEYYTPTGLNAKDVNGYAGGLNTYTQPGVKIWHIDARVIQYEYDNLDNITGLKYIDRFDHPEWYYYSIAASNSRSYSMDTNVTSNSPNRLISLVQSSGNNTFATSSFSRYYGSNSSLFHAGDVFSLSKYNKFFPSGKFNDGTSFTYKVNIGELTSDGVTLTITK